MASMFRHPASVALLVLLGGLVLAGVLLVPWDVHPPSAAAQADAVAGLPAETVAAGKEFAAATRPGSYIAMGLSLAVALLLGLTPLGARIIEWCGRPFGGHWLAEAVLGGVAVVLAAQLVTLPLSAWRHTILVRFGLSTQTWGAWAADLAKSYGVTVVTAAIMLAGLYGLMRLSPRLWWLWASAAAGVLVVVMSAVYPVVVEPLFNRFTPMADGPLRTELIEMAERDGLPVTDVLVADASRRTTAVNAYVSGLGPTRRIVVYDTLLEAPREQVVSVVAHELGHAKHGDVWVGTSIGALAVAAAACGIAVLAGAGGLLRRAGVDDITSPRSAGLILAAVAVVGLLAGPVQNVISRQIEMRADQHALELTGDPQTFIEMQTGLATTNLSDVDPPTVLHWLFGSHPTTAQRIAMAKEYA
ncbi:M48 family metallopeptidase [Stackebrandtia albiflava]|nr:M48 family metallopeptidase [Stackebrandtia albiflava]